MKLPGSFFHRLGEAFHRAGRLMSRLIAGTAALSVLQACTLIDRPPAASTPETAARTAYLLCDGCHGPRDIRVDTMSPRIIAQKQGYLAEKLKDYRSGVRTHPWMDGVARDLTDQDIAQLAAYYSARPQPRAQ